MGTTVLFGLSAPLLPYSITLSQSFHVAATFLSLFNNSSVWVKTLL
jgi:hypothetical protein